MPRRREIDSLLSRIVTFERTPALFAACFPDKILIELYKDEHAHLYRKVVDESHKGNKEGLSNRPEAVSQSESP